MPQPVDINTELARSVTVQRIQELADRASLAAQHRHAQHAQQEQLDAETRVQESPESEHQAEVTDKQQTNHEQHGRGDTAREQESDAGTDAGEIEVIADAAEQHRLDVTA